MRGDKTLAAILEPMNDALNHPDVTDIVVNEPYRVGVRRCGIWEWLDVPSFDFDTLDAATILIGQRTGKEFDESRCYVNSTLPGGQRFQGVRPPGTKEGHILWAIRRPPGVARKVTDPDYDDLFIGTNTGNTQKRMTATQLGSLYKAKDWGKLLSEARMSGASMAFCGSTSSGKTDMIRRMAQVYRPNIRMVTIETDDEFGGVGPINTANLFYDDTRISPDEAVRITLRLCPVEIVLQEIRGQESYSMLRALESGHNGLTSFHSEEGRELEAIAMMARMHPAGRDMSESRLIEMARNAFDVICYCERDDTEFRVSSVRLMAAQREEL